MVMHLRRFFLFLIVLLIILAAFLTLGYFSLRRSLPVTQGKLPTTICSAPVEVRRDSLAVVHLRAENITDLFSGYGYVCAQDRLFNMELLRRMAQGRLAEWIGVKGLEIDRLARTIGFVGLGEQMLAQLPETTRALLDAYVAGINGFIEGNSGRFSVEFSLIRTQPEPWRSADCLAVQRMLAWEMSLGRLCDPVYADLAMRLPPQKLADLLPVPGAQPTAAKTLDGAERFLARDEATLLANKERFSGFSGTAYLVSGQKSRSNLPYLANDLHLPFVVPNPFYIIHLQCPGIEAAGVCIPSIPGILAGRNRDIAWGVTCGLVDDVDFFVEKVDSLQNLYYSNGRWLPLQVVEEMIAVQGHELVPLQIRMTAGRPLVDHLSLLFSASSAPLSVKWSGFAPSDELSAMLGLLVARDMSDFRRAISTWKTPALNFVFADRAGHFGHQLAAAEPIRRSSTGFLPKDGRSAQDGWTGWTTLLPNASQYDPAAETLVCADSWGQAMSSGSAQSKSFAYHHKRAMALIDSLAPLGIVELRAMQNDIYSEQAAELLPVLLPLLDASAFDYPAGKEIYAFLQDWDYQETDDSIAAAFFEWWYLQLMRDILQDDLTPEGMVAFFSLPLFNLALFDRLLYQSAHWVDRIDTPERYETMREIVTDSYVATLEAFYRRSGGNLGGLRWGDLHSLEQRHMLAQTRPLSRLLNIGPTSAAGGNVTLNHRAFLLNAPFAVSTGSSVRQIADLSNSHDLWLVLSSGQSGHLLSNHYRDQHALWHEGRLAHVSLDRDSTSSARDRILYLLPAE